VAYRVAAGESNRRWISSVRRFRNRTFVSRPATARSILQQRKAPAERPDTARAPALTLKSGESDVASVIDCALANPYAGPAGPLAGSLALGPLSGRRAGRLSLAGNDFV